MSDEKKNKDSITSRPLDCGFSDEDLCCLGCGIKLALVAFGHCYATEDEVALKSHQESLQLLRHEMTQRLNGLPFDTAVLERCREAIKKMSLPTLEAARDHLNSAEAALPQISRLVEDIEAVERQQLLGRLEKFPLDSVMLDHAHKAIAKMSLLKLQVVNRTLDSAEDGLMALTQLLTEREASVAQH